MKTVIFHFPASFKDGVTRKPAVVSINLAQVEVEMIGQLARRAVKSGRMDSLFRRVVNVPGCNVAVPAEGRTHNLSDWGGVCRSDRAGNLQMVWEGTDFQAETESFKAEGLDFAWQQAQLVAISDVRTNGTSA